MIRAVFSLIAFAAAACCGAQGSGIFFESHASRGKMNRDNLYHFEWTQIGILKGDSVYFIENGREGKRYNDYFASSSYPVAFQYAVRYALSAGYEKSFSRTLSVRAAVGYQNAAMDAYGAMILYDSTNRTETEVPYVNAQIERRWLTIPVDVKLTLPLRENGLYCAVGPRASILLSSKYRDKISNASEDLGNFMPHFNLALGARLGAEFAVARAGYLFLEAGYHYGLLNTSPVSAGNTGEGEIALFEIGFRIPFPPGLNN